MSPQKPVDILILSNGPGEIATWVRPVVKNIRQQLGNNVDLVRISVVLSPCPHSTGKESAIALSYPEVDRVLPPAEFFSFLLRGKTKDNWHWRDRGIVVFLGGDQFYTLILGKRLGYSTLVYAEWEARWYRWLDRFAVMNQTAIDKVPPKYRHKLTAVGDLMADVSLEVKQNPDFSLSPTPQIGLLVGSKPAKLYQGVPLCLAIAEKIAEKLPDSRFIIPVAPTLNIEDLATYADPQQNELIPQLGNVSGQLIAADNADSYLLTANGTQIKLIEQFPAYATLIECQICLTTVGANTAELGSLGIPMVVLLPTQQLDAMRSWDGLPGILANLPGLGSLFAKIINWLILRQKRLFAWPNIWAKTEIVPELVGKLQPQIVADLVLDYLNHPAKLKATSDRLMAVRGNAGAAKQIAESIEEVLK